MSELRDHSQPCEHNEDWYWEKLASGGRVFKCANQTCPGGRLVTDDEIVAAYQAQTNAAPEIGETDGTD